MADNYPKTSLDRGVVNVYQARWRRGNPKDKRGKHVVRCYSAVKSITSDCLADASGSLVLQKKRWWLSGDSMLCRADLWSVIFRNQTAIAACVIPRNS